MPVQRFSLILMIALILMLEFCVIATYGEVGKSEAASVLTDADGSVVSAYRVVLEAEQVGANVSSLLDQLNEAGRDLSLAHIAYEQGYFEKATNIATESRNTAEEVQNAAVDLKNSALYESAQHTWLTVTGSIVGVVLLSLGSLWVWRVFKRRYYRRVLGMRPEVPSGES